MNPSAMQGQISPKFEEMVPGIIHACISRLMSPILPSIDPIILLLCEDSDKPIHDDLVALANKGLVHRKLLRQAN
jgi:hypothetical protein